MKLRIWFDTDLATADEIAAELETLAILVRRGEKTSMFFPIRGKIAGACGLDGGPWNLREESEPEEEPKDDRDHPSLTAEERNR